MQMRNVASVVQSVKAHNLLDSMHLHSGSALRLEVFKKAWGLKSRVLEGR